MLEEGAMKELTEKIKSAKEELRKYEKELAKANKRLDESGTEQPANLRDAVTLIYSMLATIQSRITEHEKEYSKHKTAIAEYLAEFEQMSSESEEDVRTRNFEMKRKSSKHL